MASRKRLKSVVQSLAHHAASGHSYLHPDLENALHGSGLRDTTIDLLASASPHPLAPIGSPLARAIEALRERFQKILASEGFTLADVTVVKVRFRQNESGETASLIADVQLVLTDGTPVVCAVDGLGQVRDFEAF